MFVLSCFIAFTFRIGNGRKAVFTLCCFLACLNIHAQQTKSSSADTSTQSHFLKGILQQVIASVKKNHDTAISDLYYTGKSEAPYMPFEGKIIRHINIKSLDFERTFSDTSIRIVSFASRIGNKLHINTKEREIRNNLFIKERTPLNAYKVADNERYLRTLDYIHDARILIQLVHNNPDSIDLLVVTKDFFSISVDASSDVLNHVHVNVAEANVAGEGQRVEVSGLYDYNRNPNFGSGLLYRKNNIGNSFINGSASVSSILIDPASHEEESGQFISFSRPLVSPYLHFAGGLSYSHYQASNMYKVPDSTFFKYNYNYFDAWIGYNLGVNKLLAGKNAIRDRTFLSLRYFDYYFNNVPYQVDHNFDPLFNNRAAVLAQLTFFRQDYYKTQYIYGFGTTEDFPYGYNIALTGGWHKQLDHERPYLGFHAFRYFVTNSGEFIQLFFRTGGFIYNKQVQDGSLLIGGTAFSRLYFWNDIKIRQFIGFNFSALKNRVTYAPLRIDNPYGIRGFLSDSAYADRRITISLETEFYLKPRLFGFQFAPFVYGDFSLLAPHGSLVDKSSLYSSIGGGIRTRNENLIFETIELRLYFYPVTPNNVNGFKVVLNSNIRYRYISNYVTEPDVVQLNAEQ